MLMRTWTTTIDPVRAGDYERFAHDISAPMFREQAGFLGLIMARAGALRSVITFWKNEAAIAALEASQRYIATVELIGRQGFLDADQSVAVMVVHQRIIDGMLAGSDAFEGEKPTSGTRPGARRPPQT